MKNKFIELRDKISSELYPAFLNLNNSEWNFFINSTEENMRIMNDYQEKYSDIYKDKNTYEELKKLKDTFSGHEHKQLLKLLKDFEEELNSGEELKILRKKENEIAQKYNSYVLKIDNKEVSRTEISKILQTEPDIEIRRKAYEANIKAADLIADDLKEFIKMRNDFALKQGYSNYFEYKLKEEYEVDLNELSALLDEVYIDSSKVINEILAKKQKELKEFFNTDSLESYHYGYLTNNNPEKVVNKCFANKEQIVEISKKAYKNMGWDIDKLLEEKKLVLDLFSRKGKNTHGFCFGIDAGKDTRILANLTNNTYSLDTLNHELGHCVYTLGVSEDLPFLDRSEYPAMTEAVAMMMGDIQKRENILSDIVPCDVLEEFKQTFKEDEANFVSKSLTIINFEKEMYKNPGQDLKKLWHDMKVKYQNRSDKEKSDNGWAAIPHYLSHPAYYQNYFRAALIKAQMYKYLGELTTNSKTAEILNEKLFKYGISLEESELIEIFTGKKLSSKDFTFFIKRG